MQSQDTTIATDVETTAALSRQRWSTLLRSWGKSGRAVLPTFLGTRLLLLVLTYFGGILFKVDTNSTFALNLNSILYNWYHWDAQRNVTIATQGYIDPSYSTLFPLYPTLIHLGTTITHLDPLLIGMLISNGAFFVALVVLYRLILSEQTATGADKNGGEPQALKDEQHEKLAQRGILYLAVFPTALFFFAAYNTALLLLFSLLCLYLLRNGRWWLAGMCGALAALTDITGILLFIIFLCEFFHQRTRLQTRGHIQRWLPLIAALCIPCGLLIYCLGLYTPFHDPLLFLHPQAGSDTVPAGAWATMQQALSGGWLTYAAAHTLFELLIAIGLLSLLVLGWYGQRQQMLAQWPLWLYGLLILCWGLLSARQPGTLANQFDPLPAMQYAALLCIPAFIVLARLGKRTWLHHSYLLGAMALQSLLIFQMFIGHWAQ
jgi:Predicted integral membrane protein